MKCIDLCHFVICKCEYHHALTRYSDRPSRSEGTTCSWNDRFQTHICRFPLVLRGSIHYRLMTAVFSIVSRCQDI